MYCTVLHGACGDYFPCRLRHLAVCNTFDTLRIHNDYRYSSTPLQAKEYADKLCICLLLPLHHLPTLTTAPLPTFTHCTICLLLPTAPFAYVICTCRMHILKGGARAAACV